jgi:AIPR protein
MNMAARPAPLQRNAATLLDWSLVEKGIEARLQNSPSRKHAFQSYVLENVFSVLPDTTDEYIVDGGLDRGIDFIYIDHDARSINIASTKVVVEFKKAVRNFPGAAIDKVISFVDDLIHRRESLLADTNPLLALKIREIWDILEEENYQISVHLYSNQTSLIPVERERLRGFLDSYNIPLYERHLYELSHGVIRASKPKFTKTIKPANGNSFEYLESDARAIIARLRLADMYEFLVEAGTKAFDERLVSQNVRYFLGAGGPVNREIRQTLMRRRANEFSLINNGMTIVCDQMLLTTGGCFPIKLVNPQIVNGGQTAMVIWTIGGNPPSDFVNGSINIKIIQTSDAELIERIAIGSNTQNRIFGRDLRANDDVQTRIATALSAHGYYYQRKRGEQPPSQSLRIIDALRAGQMLLAYFNGDPTKAKTGTNEIFGDFYESIFDPNKVTAELIKAAYVCYERIQDKKRAALAYQRRISRDSFDEAWIDFSLLENL